MAFSSRFKEICEEKKDIKIEMNLFRATAAAHCYKKIFKIFSFPITFRHKAGEWIGWYFAVIL